MKSRKHVLQVALLLIAGSALAQEDVSLYDERGSAVAYIAPDEGGRTIFLWGGTPVAYLEGDNPDIQVVYGFNGRPLGVFTAGLIVDKDGKTLCATSGQLEARQPDPPKPAKAFTPVKAYPKFGPPYVTPSSTWSGLGCATWLSMGRE